MTSGLTEPLRRLHRKLTFAVWLGRCARQGAMVMALSGVAILVARAGFDVEFERARWLLLPLLAVPFTAWAGVRGRIPSKAGTVAWLDLRSGAQGHLLTAFELGDGRWSEPLTRQIDRLPELPPIRLGNLARPFMPALAFAALALFVPLTRAEPGTNTGFFDTAIAGLAQQLETLGEVSPLDEIVQKELQDRVDQLAENVDAEKPEAMLEAIDSLRKDLGEEGQSAAEAAQELFDRFGHTENLAPLQSAFAKTLLKSGMREMMKNGIPEGLLDKIESLAPELAKQLMESGLKMPEGFELPKGLELDPKTIAALSQLMREQLRSNLGDLDLAGLANLAKLKLGGDPTSLAKLIEKFHKCDESCDKPGGT